MSGSPMSIVTGVAFVLALGLLATGVATNHWYVIDVGGKTSLGLFKSCLEGKCEGHEFSEIASDSCGRSEAQVKRFFYGMRGSAISATVLAALAAAASFASFATGVSAASGAALGLGILTAIGSGASIAVFAFFIDNWVFCDKSFCDFFALDDCTNTFGWSFYVVAAATLFSLVGIITAALAMRGPGDQGEAAGGAQHDDVMTGTVTQSPTRAAAYEYHETTRTTTTTTTYPTDDAAYNSGVPAPPEGDWVYDEGSGYYWSDSHYLYLDTTTNEYYDPNSGYWYSPETGEWYLKE